MGDATARSARRAAKQRGGGQRDDGEPDDLHRDLYTMTRRRGSGGTESSHGRHDVDRLVRRRGYTSSRWPRQQSTTPAPSAATRRALVRQVPGLQRLRHRSSRRRPPRLDRDRRRRNRSSGLVDVDAEEAKRISTGVPELDRVSRRRPRPGLASCSSAASRASASRRCSSARSARSRAAGARAARHRRGVDRAGEAPRRRGSAAPSSVEILAETELEAVCATLERERPDVCVIDSIQTLYAAEIELGARLGRRRCARPPAACCASRRSRASRPSSSAT